MLGGEHEINSENQVFSKTEQAFGHEIPKSIEVPKQDQVLSQNPQNIGSQLE